MKSGTNTAQAWEARWKRVALRHDRGAALSWSWPPQCQIYLSRHSEALTPSALIGANELPSGSSSGGWRSSFRQASISDFNVQTLVWSRRSSRKKPRSCTPYTSTHASARSPSMPIRDTATTGARCSARSRRGGMPLSSMRSRTVSEPKSRPPSAAFAAKKAAKRDAGRAAAVSPSLPQSLGRLMTSAPKGARKSLASAWATSRSRGAGSSGAQPYRASATMASAAPWRCRCTSGCRQRPPRNLGRVPCPGDSACEQVVDAGRVVAQFL